MGLLLLLCTCLSVVVGSEGGARNQVSRDPVQIHTNPSTATLLASFLAAVFGIISTQF